MNRIFIALSLFGVLCITGVTYSYYQVEHISKFENVRTSTAVIPEYINLILDSRIKDLIPSYSYIGNVRSPVETFNIDSRYWLVISRLDSLEDTPLDTGIIEKEENVQLDDSVYNVINEPYFRIVHLMSSPKPSKNIYLGFEGDSLKTIIRNDSIVQYYLVCKRFSIRYKKNGPVDFVGRVKDDEVPVNVLFIKRNNRLYFALLSVNSMDAVLPYNYLSALFYDGNF